MYNERSMVFFSLLKLLFRQFSYELKIDIYLYKIPDLILKDSILVLHENRFIVPQGYVWW
jgi:hypothetical protein